MVGLRAETPLGGDMNMGFWLGLGVGLAIALAVVLFTCHRIMHLPPDV